MRPLLVAALLVTAMAGCFDAPADEEPESPADEAAGASGSTPPELPPPGDPPGNATGLGSGRFCELQPDATVKCWGENDAGQLGSTPGPD